MVVWKKLRLERLEQSAALSSLNAPILNQQYKSQGLNFKDSARWLMDHLDVLTDEYVEQYSELLDQSELYVDKELSAKELKQIQSQHPELYKSILNQAMNHELFTDIEPTPAELAAFNVSPVPSVVVKFVPVAIAHVLSIAEEVLWVYENAAKIRQITITIKEQRLMKLMELEMPRRIKDDLSRIFFRTLTELRKHQQWRQARNTVDITPKSSN